MKIRRPAVSGSFYPGEEEELREMLDKFFKEVPLMREINIKAGISPHAGYIYSGRTASYLYKNLKRENFKRAIILGPSHHFSFEFACLDENEKWETPLGLIDIDTEFASDLKQKEFFKFDSTFHQPEHSIEVQVPFLQFVFGNEIKIVPLLIGTYQKEILDSIANVLREYSDERTLLIASSDFYHGYSYNECKKVNEISKPVLEKLNAEDFFRKNIRNEIMACGFAPVYILLKTFENTDKKSKILYMTTSADITGDKSGYVVGYISCAIYE